MDSSPRTAGAYIRSLREARRLTQRELARRAGVDSSNISRIERSEQPLTHSMVEAIADALHVDVLPLKRLAGLRTITPPAERDSRVEYIAQRLDALPSTVKEEAIEAVGATLDAIYNLTALYNPAAAEAAEDLTTGYE